jgi:2-polyprenyl-6-hydroxyphenyl methylase/3-demethylubiquinone-9 3-methyltransferase
MMNPADSDTHTAASIDRGEVKKFADLAERWWDPDGPMRPLHRINPVRLAYLRERIDAHFGRDPAGFRPLDGLSVLDIGCGAGLISEPLARLGGTVTGIDPAEENIAIARFHAAQSGLAIDYRATTVEEVASRGDRFDLVLALEVVEHVADVPGFVASAAACLKPGGLTLFSTINRSLRAFTLAIVGAEYVLRWLPVGTHDWEKFVRPDELARAMQDAGLTEEDRRGLVFNPLANRWSLSGDTAVNYFLSATKPDA